jgi:hypothetical protein
MNLAVKALTAINGHSLIGSKCQGPRASYFQNAYQVWLRYPQRLWSSEDGNNRVHHLYHQASLTKSLIRKHIHINVLITRSNSPKQALGSLCGSGRVWWKMKNCILSLALSGQFFWLSQFLIFWVWEAPQPEPYEIFLWDMIKKIRNLITFLKLAQLLRYSTGNLKNN